MSKTPTAEPSSEGTPVRQKPGWVMGLPLPLTLAARYLKSSRRDAYVSFLSMLAAGGIALGVAALILVLSGLAGLQAFLRSDVLARTPHLEIELPPETDAEQVRERLAAALGQMPSMPSLEEARVIVRGRGWMLIGGQFVDVRVVGYSGSLPSVFTRSPEAAPEGVGVVISENLANRWALERGTRVQLVSPRPTLTPLGPQPRVVAQRVSGTYLRGRTEQNEERIAVPLPVAKSLFGARLQRLELRTTGLEAALDLVGPLQGMLPAGSRIVTWQDLNRGLFFALKLEKRLMFLSVFLIVPVAAMALVTVLALLLSSKREEIGMLHAMGARPSDLHRAFLALGMSLAGIGLLLGGIVGVGGSFLLDHFELIAPPGDVYFLDHIPFVVQWEDLLAIAGATLLLTLASTAYAARRAADAGPLEALRS